MPTVYKLCSHFQLLGKVNGPPNALDSKTVMVNSCVASGCSNWKVAFAFKRFHVVNRGRNCGLLHLNGTQIIPLD